MLLGEEERWSRGEEMTPGELHGTTHALSLGLRACYAERIELLNVVISVASLERSIAFYESVLGLRVLSRTEGGATLGAGSRALVELVEKPGAPPASPRSTGLYHFALLVPARGDLGAFLRHAVETRYPLQGAADHLVSEAVYLTDPDQHGIEVYWDRPRSEWKRDGERVEMSVDPLDAGELMALAPKGAGLPEGTVLGHVHLRVADVDAAERFYVGLMGFSVTAHLPGASFVAADGYHHHFGLNEWSSRGGVPAPESAARLERVRFRREGFSGGIIDPAGVGLELVT